jgi:GNAT superfamily N-acetyltransferase
VRLSNAGSVEGDSKTELPPVLDQGYYEAFSRINHDSTQYLMVAELDGKVIGTFQVTFLTYLAAGGREDCQIESVHVDSKYRGQGIGEKIQLTTNKKRKDAHRFYERLGFVMTHEGAKLVL